MLHTQKTTNRREEDTRQQTQPFKNRSIRDNIIKFLGLGTNNVVVSSNNYACAYTYRD
jgi:hypothetical protein